VNYTIDQLDDARPDVTLHRSELMEKATLANDTAVAVKARGHQAASCDVAVVGAGPYGLAAAARLQADGARVVVFGEPMSFWETQMPRGMILRSPYVACSIGDPSGELSLPSYEKAIGEAPEAPVPLTRFVDYGKWVQEQVAPDVRREWVTRVERNGSGFYVTGSPDSEPLHATRVVVAAGIGNFAHYPDVFRNLPSDLVSHTSEHDDLGRFSGAHVLVIGAGQSALESAALLSEQGAEVEVAARNDTVHWLTRRWHHRIPVLSRLLYAPPDVGPAGISWMVALPHVFRMPPRSVQTKMATRALRPAGSAWLPPRLGKVQIDTSAEVAGAEPDGDGVSVRFADGTSRSYDKVLLGTGYRVDVSRYEFIAPELMGQLALAGGYPVLSRGMESSVSGLHFMGAPAAWSFGPLMRFVAGTAFAAGELARGVAARSRGAR
jgi:hypothetical protein